MLVMTPIASISQWFNVVCNKKIMTLSKRSKFPTVFTIFSCKTTDTTAVIAALYVWTSSTFWQGFIGHSSTSKNEKQKETYFSVFIQTFGSNFKRKIWHRKAIKALKGKVFSLLVFFVFQRNFTGKFHKHSLYNSFTKCDIYRLAKELTLITVFSLVSRDTKTMVATKTVNTSCAIFTWITHYTLVYI